MKSHQVEYIKHQAANDVIQAGVSLVYLDLPVQRYANNDSEFNQVANLSSCLSSSYINLSN